MTEPVAPSDEGPGYELRIEGHLDEHWSTWFGGMTLSHENDGCGSKIGTVWPTCGSPLSRRFSGPA